MKKIILFMLSILSFYWYFSYSNFVHENCNTWIYSSYYNSKANICWYYAIRLYPWKIFDFVDYWKWTEWKERLLKKSESLITPFNLDATKYLLTFWTSEFSSNWISAQADQSWYSWKTPVIWWVYDVWLKSSQDISKLNRNVPVARLDWDIMNYKVDNDWNIEPSLTDWKYCTTSTTVVSWVTQFSSCDYVSNTWIKKTKSSLKWEHFESYVILPAWCWDWVVSNWEECDNGLDNFKWVWNPTVKNEIACNSSCHIMYPTCWSAIWNYEVSKTSFDGDFCWQYSSLSWANPLFPAQWSSVTWTCALWNQTIICNASRWGWWGWGWWGW